MNESPAGRDGYILAHGRKIYHAYKQSFPMEFWYGLTATDNRECSPGLIDVRTLPEKYRTAPLEFSGRGCAAISRQLAAHALAFAKALHDGYDLEAHVARENARAEAEWQQQRAEQLARQAAADDDEDDVPF